MATAVLVWIGAELEPAVRFVRLNPALDRASNGRVIVVHPAIHDRDAHARPGTINPGRLRA
jgi:hypothetical protein